MCRSSDPRHWRADYRGQLARSAQARCCSIASMRYSSTSGAVLARSGADAATLLAFAETFGDLDTPHHVYPHVPGYERIVLLENDGDRPPNTDVWHTDLTFKQQPPFAAILYANAIPASGDTLRCSMYAAYDALTDGMKAISATSVPCMPPARTGINFLPKAGSRVSMKAWRPWERRCIRSPPPGHRQAVSLRQSAFHDARLRAVQRRQSAPADGVVRPHQPARLSGPAGAGSAGRWRCGTNRITQHYAAADYLPQYRCMHRVTVVNDRRSPKP